MWLVHVIVLQRFVALASSIHNSREIQSEFEPSGEDYLRKDGFCYSKLNRPNGCLKLDGSNGEEISGVSFLPIIPLQHQ